MHRRSARDLFLLAVAAPLLSLGGVAAHPDPAREAPPPDQEIARTSAVEEAEVSLVLIDAVVEGKEGRPLRGLRLEDFTLLVDGRRASIASFEDHCPVSPPSREAVSPAPGSLPPGSTETSKAPEEALSAPPTGASGPPPARVVLYFDLPHLSPDGAARSVSAARRFFESAAGPATLYMVAAYGRSVKVLTPFTTDRSRVLAALEEVLEIGGPYDEGPFSRVNNVQQVTRETCPRKAESERPGGLGSACPNQVLAAKLFAQQEETLARRSLAAATSLLVALSGIEGRKALVFFTETLKDEPGVQYLEIARTTPRGEGIDVNLDLRHLVDEAGAASVAFYPVYAAGLDDRSDMQLLRSQSGLGGAGTVSRTVTKALSGTPSGQELAASLTPTRSNEGASLLQEDVGAIERAFRTAEAASLGFNASVAAQTGGRHLGRTNDLSLIFPLVAEETSCFYVLSYVAPPPHDGSRHTLRLDVGVKGVRVRSRTFYVDSAPAERREQRFRTALAAPGAFRDFEVDLHLFPFGRSRAGRRILVMTDVPVSALAASAAASHRGGGAAVVKFRTRVAAEGTERCSLGKEFTLAGPIGADGGTRRLHLEGACDLAPGRYEVVTAVMERRGETIAATRREIDIPPAAAFHVSEPQLWAASDADLVEASQAASIVGRTEGAIPGAASPRAHRRLRPGERGLLLFLVCPETVPPSGGSGTKGGPVTVARAILAGETPVATFPPLSFDAPPEGDCGCWAVSTPLPERIFGDGVYQFDYEVRAPGLEAPVRGLAAFEIGASGS